MGEPTFEAGPLLVRARRVADLSQRDLARLSGVAQSTIAAIESGDRDVRVAVFGSLLAAAGLRLAVLAPGGEELHGFAEDSVRDNAGRRFPAHLDVLPPDAVPAERITSPRYDRPEAKGWYHLRSAETSPGEPVRRRPVIRPFESSSTVGSTAATAARRGGPIGRRRSANGLDSSPPTSRPTHQTAR